MTQAKLPTNNGLLGQLAKAFIAQKLNIDPEQWGMTKDQAWVSLAAKLLRRSTQGRHIADIPPSR
jgi:hypothetical protein